MNIVFEGIDGVGKTTIINQMKKDLEGKGELVRYIDEISQNSPISEVLEKMLSSDPFFSLKTNFLTSIFESLLLAADMHYRQEKYKYNDGYNLYDRDFLSILSYQRELLKKDYKDYEKFYLPFKECVMYNLKPIDLIVYVQAPIETSINRVQIRDGINFDESQIEFLRTLKFQLENELLPEVQQKHDINILRLDGSRPVIDNIGKIYKMVGIEYDEKDTDITR